jgi:hypothetical protein
MTLQKSTPLVLLMFTLVCALSATVVSPLSAIAQEDYEEAEDVASDTVSNVLDNVNTAGDNTNTEVSVPITDQDQIDANLGLSEALDVTVERTLSPQEEEPPEDEAVFCFVDRDFGALCFITLEDCESVEDLDFFRGFVVSPCDEFETPPSDARTCRFVEPDDFTCEPPI